MHVAGEKAASRVGTRVRLLVDAIPTPEEIASDPSPCAVGAAALSRSEGEALDIDGSIYLEAGDLAPSGLAPGSFVLAEIVAADVYDLRARAVLPDMSRSRTRSALSAAV